MARLTPITHCVNCRYCVSESAPGEPNRVYCVHPKLRGGRMQLLRDECGAVPIPEWCPLPVAKGEV